MGTFCDRSDHYIINCSSLANLSPTLRFKESKRSLCLNCLKKGHGFWKRKPNSCRFYNLKHNLLLRPLLYHNLGSNNLLATAVILVKINLGIHVCRKIS